MCTVRRFLDLSTAHLPRELGAAGLDETPGVIAHPTGHGWFLWVPHDPDDSADAMSDPIPAVVLTIQRYARALDCDYVHFDADADRVDDLPAWDW